MKFEMLEMSKDSFLRAVIRFWNNRFLPKDNPTELFREEISYLRRRNDDLVSFILNSIKPNTAEVDEPEIDEEFKSIGASIETTIKRRRRLEQVSLSQWNKLVQEAKDKAVRESASVSKSTKTTEELETELGLSN